jgi:hypothetical protein
VPAEIDERSTAASTPSARSIEATGSAANRELPIPMKRTRLTPSSASASSGERSPP